MSRRRVRRVTALLALLASTTLVTGWNLYEDGSGVVTFCIPGAPCDGGP